MKLNGIEIRIASYTSEALDDEMVLYNEESKKIIVLNQTAAIVWNEIAGSQLNGKDICTAEIANKILQIYNLSQTEFDKVSDDVDETIENLFKSLLLTQ